MKNIHLEKTFKAISKMNHRKSSSKNFIIKTSEPHGWRIHLDFQKENLMIHPIGKNYIGIELFISYTSW